MSGTDAFNKLFSVSRWAGVFYRQLGRQAQLVIDVIKVNTDKDIQVKHVSLLYYVYMHMITYLSLECDARLCTTCNVLLRGILCSPYNAQISMCVCVCVCSGGYTVVRV